MLKQNVKLICLIWLPILVCLVWVLCREVGGIRIPGDVCAAVAIDSNSETPVTPSAPSKMRRDRLRPRPKMYVSPISTRLLGGRSTPAMRAKTILPR